MNYNFHWNSHNFIIFGGDDWGGHKINSGYNSCLQRSIFTTISIYLIITITIKYNIMTAVYIHIVKKSIIFQNKLGVVYFVF